MASIVVAGGGMCGLAAAMMLADDGHAVTVVERDPAAPPADPDGATTWQRRSVAQFGLAHWLHARGTAIMRDRLPRVHQLMATNGGKEFNLVKFFLSMQPGAEVVPDDDRFDQLTGRRSTLEWAFATAAAEHPHITVRRGEAIAGFTAGVSVLAGVPHVSGLRLDSGELFPADLVIDATGRRSSTPQWLADIGARPPAEDAQDSGFAYYGRYFRSADGATPAIMGPLLAPYGSFSVLTLPADNGTWSVTLYALAEDKPLRRFRDAAVYDRVVRACPLQAHWLDGEPITDISSMAGVVDRHRRFVVDGRPCATGVLSVGDASSCTNPSLGRGITLGLLHVEILRSAIAEHLQDPAELALAFDHATESAVRPWHDATTAIDRRRVQEMRAVAAGGTHEPDQSEQIALLLASAGAFDPIAARSFGEIFTCTTLAEQVFARPGVFEHIIGLAERADVQPLPGPDRAQLLELVR
ncbi:MAG: FAD-dependent oxidoreductase [Acidimicrobiales bacterium]